MHPQQLEKRYGGEAPDRESNYWPPSFPSNTFGEDPSRIGPEHFKDMEVNAVPKSIKKES